MVASVDQYEDFRAPVRKSRKEDFLLSTSEKRTCWMAWNLKAAYQATQEEWLRENAWLEAAESEPQGTWSEF
jgi:hypothetical protein